MVFAFYRPISSLLVLGATGSHALSKYSMLGGKEGKQHGGTAAGNGGHGLAKGALKPNTDDDNQPVSQIKQEFG